MKKRPMKTEIAFDAGELVRRVEGFAAGLEPVRGRTVRAAMTLEDLRATLDTRPFEPFRFRLPDGLPTLSGRDVVKAFARDGWQMARQRGSHITMLRAAVDKLPDVTTRS